MGRTFTVFHLTTALGLGALAGWWLRGTDTAPSLGEQALATVPSASLQERDSESVLSAAPNLEVPQSSAQGRSALPPPGSSTLLPRTMASETGAGSFAIAGSVQDESGRPLRDSAVVLTSPAGHEAVQPEGLDGTFRFGQLAPGDYELSVNNRDYYGIEKTLTLDGAPREIFEKLVLEPSQRVAVRVVQPDGAPFAPSIEAFHRLARLERPREEIIPIEIRFGLRAWPMEAPPSRWALVEGGGKGGPGRFEPTYLGTQAEGADVIGFMVLDRPPPVYVSLFRNWLHIDSLLLRPGETEVTFVVDPALLLAQYGEIRLRLVDDLSGEPVVGQVSLRHESSSGLNRRSEPDGSFQFAPASSGEHTLDVWSTQHVSLHRTLVIAPGERLDLGTLRLQPVRPLRGRVVDPEGVGVPGFTLQYASFVGPVPDRENLPRSSRQTTDEEGRFELTGLTPGPVLITGRLDVREGRERTALRIVALTIDTRETPLEDLVLQAIEPTEVELFPGPDAGSHGYWIKDGSGIIIKKGRISTKPKALWLLPGDYLAVVADDEGNEQHVAFSVGTRWTQVRLP